MKPENILIDGDGYAKLTDFGLSKDNLKNDGLAHSFCGTCEYLAPEIIQKQPYGMACDWWSFGCVLYEMLTASPPFYSKKREDTFFKIKFSTPTFYNYHSQEAVDLISKLLIKDPAKRLTQPADIKKHPFFSDMDFEMLSHKQLPTPYKPLLDS